MSNSNQEVSAKVWRWLDEVVIGQNFCPFAKAPRHNKQIDMLFYQQQSIDQLIEFVLQACKKLDINDEIETLLIVCPECLADFDDYLDMLDAIQDTLVLNDYEGVYQLASFHPRYLFAGEPKNATSHYTNRAPYPIFHIIRERSISHALTYYHHPERIPERNIEHALSLGEAFFKRYL